MCYSLLGGATGVLLIRWANGRPEQSVLGACSDCVRTCGKPHLLRWLGSHFRPKSSFRKSLETLRTGRSL